MNEPMWYWQYTILFWNESDKLKEIRSGVIAAKTMKEVIDDLCSYYGEDCILNITSLKAITDSVFDFYDANEEEDFDFEIISKDD